MAACDSLSDALAQDWVEAIKPGETKTWSIGVIRVLIGMRKGR